MPKSRPIIHVAGPPASGKTTLGRELKARLGTRARVVDLDSFHTKFTGSPPAYQAHIDAFIARTKSPIVFVGLNAIPGKADHLFDLHATHQYYIDVPQDALVKRHFIREIACWTKWMSTRDHTVLYEQLAADPIVRSDLLTSLGRVLDLDGQRRMIAGWRAHFPNHVAGTYSAIRDRIITVLGGLKLEKN